MPFNAVSELLPFLVFRVAYDSFKAGGLRIDQEELLEKAITRGVNIMFFKNGIQMRFNPTNTLAMGFLTQVLTQSGLVIAYRMIRNRGYSLNGVLWEAALDQAINFGGKFALNMVGMGSTPLNGLGAILPQVPKGTALPKPPSRPLPTTNFFF